MEFTIHTDESGAFEGLDVGFGVVVAIVLPQMPADALAKCSDAFGLIAPQQGADRLKLHASEWPSRAQRDSALSAFLLHLVDASFVPTIHVMLAARLKRSTHALTGAGFAANRYQRCLADTVAVALRHTPALSAEESAVHLRLASRVIKVKTGNVQQLLELGYRRHRTCPDKVYIADVHGIRLLLQGALQALDPFQTATVESVKWESVSKSSDPRYVVADFMANAVYRRRDGDRLPTRAALLEAFPILERCDLRLWEHGRAFTSLTDAVAALDDDAPLAALTSLTSVPQPTAHGVIVAQTAEAIAVHPTVVRRPTRLLDLAESLLDARQYDAAFALVPTLHGLLDPAQPTRVRLRAFLCALTTANHLGRIDAPELVDTHLPSLFDSERDGIDAALALSEATNKLAVAHMNAFDFGQAFDLARDEYERFIALLGRVTSGGRDWRLGHLAGTAAQAAGHLEKWGLATEWLDKASEQLGEDHMQAAFRAHAFLAQGQKAKALEAAAQNLGSTYSAPGYDMARGRERLARPLDSLEAAIAPRTLFEAYLIVRLIESGCLEVNVASQLGRLQELCELTRALDTDHHPVQLLRNVIGRWAWAVSKRNKKKSTCAQRLGDAAHRLLKKAAEASLRPEQSTLILIRGQARALLCVGYVSDGAASEQAKALARELSELEGRMGLPQPFAPLLARMSGPSAADARAACASYLERFTYLYR